MARSAHRRHRLPADSRPRRTVHGARCGWWALLAAAMAAALSIAAGLTAPAAIAQARAVAAPGVSGSGQVATVEALQRRIAGLEKTRTLPESARAEALQLYRDAIGSLEAAHEHQRQAAEFRQQIESAPAQAAALRRDLDRAAPPSAATALEGVEIGKRAADVETRLREEQASFAAARVQLDLRERQWAAESERPSVIRDELAAARRSLAGVGAGGATPARGEPPALTDARRASVGARRQEHSAQIERLEQEIVSHAPRLDLLAAQRDMARLAVESSRVRVVALETLRYQRQSAEALVAEESARREIASAAGQHAFLRRVAEANRELGRRLGEVVERSRRSGSERDQVRASLERLQQDFERARPQLQATGEAAPVGESLLFLRERIDRMAPRREQLDSLRGAASSLGLALHQHEDQRQGLADLPGAVERLFRDAMPESLSPQEAASLKPIATRLLEEQRSLLDRLVDAEQNELHVLADIEHASKQLASAIDEMGRSIDGRLLWSRTLPASGLDTLRAVPQAAVRVLGGEQWRAAGEAAVAGFRSHPVVALVLACLAVLLAASRHRVAAELRATGGGRADSMRGTLRAMLLTVLLAMPAPLVLLVAGGFMMLGLAERSRGIAAGTAALGLWLLHLGSLRQVFRRDGLATAHFGWTQPLSDRVWRQLRWSVPVIGLLLFAGVAATHGSLDDRQSLGRIAFALVGLLLVVVVHRLLGETAPGATSVRGRALWHLVGVGLPLAFTLLLLAGYSFTAAEVGSRARYSFWLITTIVLLDALAQRWLTLRQRELASRPATSSVRTGVDLPQMEHRARLLLQAAFDFATAIGLFLIWSGLLPALASSTAFHLWDRTALVNGVQQALPVTVADVALAIVIGVFTAIAARNIPGLLQMLLLPRLTADSGLRFALTTVTQYAIVGIGSFALLNALGADWSKLQWLDAALGVGLGFGLQEVVANFVCGLIILFERPVRVGDVITVGEVSGTVARISIRATHLTDFDRKTVVVPNKALITGQVVNWTLSGRVTRISTTVGVAYGSDPERVQRLILEALGGIASVLQVPPPTAVFTRFGDSALEFEVQMFVGSLDDRPTTTHAAHVAVERVLRENGIDIPFPQRELHIRDRMPEVRDQRSEVGRQASDVGGP